MEVIVVLKLVELVVTGLTASCCRQGPEVVLFGWGIYSRLRDIWGWLWFSPGVVRYGGGLICIFPGSFSRVGGAFWDCALGYRYHSMGFGRFRDIS